MKNKLIFIWSSIETTYITIIKHPLKIQKLEKGQFVQRRPPSDRRRIHEASSWERERERERDHIVVFVVVRERIAYTYTSSETQRQRKSARLRGREERFQWYRHSTAPVVGAGDSAVGARPLDSCRVVGVARARSETELLVPLCGTYEGERERESEG